MIMGFIKVDLFVHNSMSKSTFLCFIYRIYFGHDHYHINYKTHIIDKIGTDEEPDIYILDFGFNDTMFGSDMSKMKFNTII